MGALRFALLHWDLRRRRYQMRYWLWRTRRLGLRVLARGVCPHCHSNPPRGECPVCRGVAPLLSGVADPTLMALWRERWLRLFGLPR